VSRRIFNWARNEHCTPTRLVRPINEEAIVAIVRAARSAGERIKVVGARHSWSDIGLDDCVLLSLDAMQRVLEVDEARSRVRVEAGIRLHRLNEELAARGLALPIVGSVTEQSVAGVISTGTHGSSLVHGNLSSVVVGMRLVTGTGEVLELDEHHPLLPAARVSLGALGVITEVTLAVVPAFRLRETTETLEFDAALAELDAIARSAEFVKLWWVPHCEQVIVFRCDRTDEPGEPSRLGTWVDAWIVNKLALPAMLLAGRAIPTLIPPCNRLVARTYLDARQRVGRSDRILSLVMPPRHRETEYAVPLAAAAAAMRANRSVIVEAGLRVNFISELRFVRADDAWMSPASGRDSAQLGAYMSQAPGVERYFADFQGAMLALDGRPHWGKEFRVSAAQIRTMYPQAEAFAATVADLDPDKVFFGRFLQRVFA
jgi:L-gulono-1,4-lactone dehydrogenase